jgi:hypothetical protein
MVSIQRRPDVLARLEALERTAADQAHVIEVQGARITALEALNIGSDLGTSRAPAVSEDGAPRPPGKWMRMKAAAAATGYSESGLRKMVRERRCVADFEGCHPLINIDSIPPRRGAKVRK